MNGDQTEGWVIDPTVVSLVGTAITQRHRITACPSCGGPEIWSRQRPESHCFRCNRHHAGEYVKRFNELRCERCRCKFVSVGLKRPNCPKCSEILKNARKVAPSYRERAETLQTAAENEGL